MIKLETDLSLVTPGGRRLVEGTVAPIRNDSDVIIGTVVALKDITEIKKKDEILYNMEYYDPLTGLPNRSLFSDRLKMALAQSKRNNEMCALIILDLDNFKALKCRKYASNTPWHKQPPILFKYYNIICAQFFYSKINYILWCTFCKIRLNTNSSYGCFILIYLNNLTQFTKIICFRWSTNHY